MTAPSKTFDTPLDAALAPGEPLTSELLTQIRDSLIHLEEWLGGSFTAAVDHNHDGVNSASLNLGTDALRNAGFEANSTSGWTEALYTGGTIATGTAGAMEGQYAVGITSTVAANGGGYLTCDQFVPVAGGETKQFRLMMKASAANVSSNAKVIWYDSAQAQISESTIYETASTPTDSRLVVRRIAAPETARYCKVKITGGVPALGSGTGTVYFDDGKVEAPAMLGGQQVFTASGTFSAVWGDVHVSLIGAGGAGSSNDLDPGGGGAGATGAAAFVTAEDVAVTVGAGGSITVGDGNDGGTTSFLTLSATGGGGGTNTPGTNGAPGVLSGADYSGAQIYALDGQGVGGGAGGQDLDGLPGGDGLVVVRW